MTNSGPSRLLLVSLTANICLFFCGIVVISKLVQVPLLCAQTCQSTHSGHVGSNAAADRDDSGGLATIAYSITAYHKFEHLQWLLEALWHGDHVFMINVDAKATEEFFLSVVELSEKYPNVYVSERRHDVIYYGWTAMWVELQAWLELINLGETRDYFINMSGQEYPIKTQCEIRSFLSEHMGKNFVTLIAEDRQSWLRDPVRCILRAAPRVGEMVLRRTCWKRKDVLSAGITI